MSDLKMILTPVDPLGQRNTKSIGWKATLRYRFLEEGETILKSDFYLVRDKLTNATCLGQKAPDPFEPSHGKYIRILREKQ
jgi:hypothetical protein